MEAKPESEKKEVIDRLMYSYTTDVNRLEDENRLLRETVNHLNGELEKYRRPPLMVCEIREIWNEKAIIKVPNGNEFYVEIASSCEKLAPGDSVLAEQKNLVIQRKAGISKKFNVDKFVIMEKPETRWEEIGGLSRQIEEIKEVVELPLLKPELFKKVGIEPPKGVLLYGPPGTGKTMLAKGVAAATNSTFIEIVGSELVQKFIGEGAKLVKEVFELAREKAPSIIFIDELDAIAAKRIEVGTSGEREVQRTFMQLLAEIDGFKPLGNVKVIGCTNRKDILDPAVIRPGRFDRLIKIPLPNDEAKQDIFRIHTKKMNVDSKVDIKKLVRLMEGFSGAEIKGVCTEAGYRAIRDNRSKVRQEDFEEGIIKIKQEEKADYDYIKMFG